ncbi:7-carboxy-7-deazaguanine synthase QueE [Candidatus Erwinia haradaeae]|uniref:7-carboxy-7-deazaguanine synthase n=1 Tax=Candidatus Erwinia haradaeae TaxID=1922217 RepID=A0A803FUH7_9GAMM|nr:7-carboxy-7-deazaguanine synthase QueE [Candidatus Erwinia haradaeae]VFP88773.1 7-carboxy-7-deazaguanine synthase [Candidatus Erwinia haradaeae]
MQYPINSIFQTLQGEGLHAGVPAIFIRLQGCPIGCMWCDTKYTWKTLLNREISLEQVLIKKINTNFWCIASTKMILNTISKYKWTAKHVVITGGEPCLHDLIPLTNALETAGFSCQIETSGTHVILCTDSTWVTVSPKINMNKNYEPLHKSLVRADEIKHPVAHLHDIEKLDLYLKTINDSKPRVILLQPISQQTNAIQLCIKTCIIRNWRLSTQIQKYLNFS